MPDLPDPCLGRLRKVGDDIWVVDYARWFIDQQPGRGFRRTKGRRLSLLMVRCTAPTAGKYQSKNSASDGAPDTLTSRTETNRT